MTIYAKVEMSKNLLKSQSNHIYHKLCTKCCELSFIFALVGISNILSGIIEKYIKFTNTVRVLPENK